MRRAREDAEGVEAGCGSANQRVAGRTDMVDRT
jgi:hypothetical protein